MLDPKKVAADWAARGFSCEIWTDPPGRCWEDFKHAVDELVVPLEGEVEFEIEGVVSRPQPGEELLIPAGAVHSARNVGAAANRWLFLATSAATCSACYTRPGAHSAALLGVVRNCPSC